MHAAYGRGSVFLLGLILWTTSCLRDDQEYRRREKGVSSNWHNREQHRFDIAAYIQTNPQGHHSVISTIALLYFFKYSSQAI